MIGLDFSLTDIKQARRGQPVPSVRLPKEHKNR
jgi:hypothetical protein